MSRLLPPAERKSGVLLAIYAALSLLMLAAGDRLPQAGLRGVGAFLFAPFDRLVLSADRLSTAWRENQALHHRIAQLELENTHLKAAEVENRRLREELGLPAWRGLTLRPVEVLALAGEPIPSAATLSAGERQNVRVGDAVVTSEGLVGRVSEVYAGTSRVTLLTDPNLAVACEVESLGVRGVLRFVPAPNPRLMLGSIPLADTVRIGQRIVTSPISLRFPGGLPVGTVVSVDKDPTGLMQDIEIDPAARLSRLRHAFVVPGPQPPPAAGFGPRPVSSPTAAPTRRLFAPPPRPAPPDTAAARPAAAPSPDTARTSGGGTP